MKIQAAIEEYAYATQNLALKTRRWYDQKLKYFADWCTANGYKDLEDIRAGVVRRYLDYLRTTPSSTTKKPLTERTIRGYAQVIKGWLAWCAQEDGIDHLISPKTIKAIEMPIVEHTVITIFTADDIAKVFGACRKDDDERLIVRNRAIIAVFLDTGGRLSELFFDQSRPEEITGLRMENTFLSPYDSHLKLYGKGKKEREV